MAKKKIALPNEKKIEAIAIQWFKDAVNGIEDRRLSQELGHNISKTLSSGIVPICELVYYKYQPKGIDTLPYWDIYPLTLIVRFDSNMFYGFNLHYMDYKYRQKIIEAMLMIKSRANTKRQSYAILAPLVNEMVQHRFLVFAYKSYLFDHVRSKFVVVDPRFYERVIYLPIQKFRRTTQDNIIMLSKRTKK